MSILTDLSGLLSGHAPIETGVLSGEAPDEYIVITPLPGHEENPAGAERRSRRRRYGHGFR